MDPLYKTTSDGYRRCPYYPHHRVEAAWFLEHLVKCSQESPLHLVPCPWDLTHHIYPERYNAHLKTCESNHKDPISATDPAAIHYRMMMENKKYGLGLSGIGSSETELAASIRRFQMTEHCTPGNYGPRNALNDAHYDIYGYPIEKKPFPHNSPLSKGSDFENERAFHASNMMLRGHVSNDTLLRMDDRREPRMTGCLRASTTNNNQAIDGAPAESDDPAVGSFLKLLHDIPPYEGPRGSSYDDLAARPASPLFRPNRPPPRATNDSEHRSPWEPPPPTLALPRAPWEPSRPNLTVPQAPWAPPRPPWEPSRPNLTVPQAPWAPPRPSWEPSRPNLTVPQAPWAPPRPSWEPSRPNRPPPRQARVAHQRQRPPASAASNANSNLVQEFSLWYPFGIRHEELDQPDKEKSSDGEESVKDKKVNNPKKEEY